MNLREHCQRNAAKALLTIAREALDPSLLEFRRDQMLPASHAGYPRIAEPRHGGDFTTRTTVAPICTFGATPSKTPNKGAPAPENGAA